jgi:hypothetical protein
MAAKDVKQPLEKVDFTAVIGGGTMLGDSLEAPRAAILMTTRAWLTFS